MAAPRTPVVRLTLRPLPEDDEHVLDVLQVLVDARHGSWLHTDTGERRVRVDVRALTAALPDTDQALQVLTRATVPERALASALLWPQPSLIDEVRRHQQVTQFTQMLIAAPERALDATPASDLWQQRQAQDALLTGVLWLGPAGTPLAAHGCRTSQQALHRARTLLAASISPPEWYRPDIAEAATDDLLVLAGFAGARPL